jgi:hypothetical protein
MVPPFYGTLQVHAYCIILHRCTKEVKTTTNGMTGLPRGDTE